jgi:hypothetical protein
MTDAKDHVVDSQGTDQADAAPEDRRLQWEEHMRQWRSSDLTQAEYCRRNELKWSTFHYWRKRLQETATTVTLVEVPVSNGLGCQSCQQLTLVLGDHYKVEIGDNFNPSTLVKLVDTLGRL